MKFCPYFGHLTSYLDKVRCRILSFKAVKTVKFYENWRSEDGTLFSSVNKVLLLNVFV
jgi:hypothetical protein